MANIDTEELEKLPTIITDVENPEVYSKDINHINKPIKNIKFGHLLNINWDNLTGAFTLIRKFLAEAIYKQDVDNKNTATKIVCRNADKSIEVGDIYCSSPINNNPFPAKIGLAYKNMETGEIIFTENYKEIMQLAGEIYKEVIIKGTYSSNSLIGGGTKFIEFNNDFAEHLGVGNIKIKKGKYKITIYVYAISTNNSSGNYRIVLKGNDKDLGSYSHMVGDWSPSGATFIDIFDLTEDAALNFNVSASGAAMSGEQIVAIEKIEY